MLVVKLSSHVDYTTMAARRHAKHMVQFEILLTNTTLSRAQPRGIKPVESCVAIQMRAQAPHERYTI